MLFVFVSFGLFVVVLIQAFQLYSVRTSRSALYERIQENNSDVVHTSPANEENKPTNQRHQDNGNGRKKKSKVLDNNNNNNNSNNNSKQKKESSIDEDTHFNMRVVARVESCFNDRRSTPRQGCLSPHTMANIVFDKYVQPTESLDGLEQFSHLWVVWVFHENTKALKSRKLKPNNNQMPLKAKIQAPRLYGKKIGLFASRTPHRPNPIGLTLMKIESIDKKNHTIRVSGVDVVDGTPVLDVKPYIPYADSRPDAAVPDWIAQAAQFGEVIVTEDATLDIKRLIQQNKTKHFKSENALVLAIEEVVKNEVPGRANFRRRCTPEGKERNDNDDDDDAVDDEEEEGKGNHSGPKTNQAKEKKEKSKNDRKGRAFELDQTKVMGFFLDSVIVEYRVLDTRDIEILHVLHSTEGRII